MKKLYFTLGTLCLMLCLLLIYFGLPKPAPEKPVPVKEAASAVVEYVSEPENVISQIPVDFEALTAINEDIYAWLYIPGTDINHPVLQSQRGDNDYYLTHTVDHQEDENGCLFTEYLYSDKLFDIPVTVIYGHRRRSGDMFGQLENIYAQPNSLDEFEEILIYTPEKMLRYQVIAESEFSDMHIPNHYRRFSDPDDILHFMEEVRQYHTLTKQLREPLDVNTQDRLLVLSTCLVREESQRFLVIAKLVEETNWNC